ncbi:MAG: amidohydrolase family protein, partial [Acidobacteria bacterium]|nr:amidohydrolase family protein [Acidobacteriota bacterium]
MQTRLFALGVAIVAAASVAPLAQAPTANDTVTYRAARVLDGRGKVITAGVVEVRGSKIVAVDQRKGPVTHELGDVTLMPGMIDVHVHIDWHFQPNGLYGQRPGQPRETPEQAAAAIQANLDATLDAGCTTVQSLGARGDKDLRDAINAGTKRGPRLLSSLGQLQPGTQTPDQLRERVRQLKTQGADAVKTFASGSIRDGGKMNVMQAQLDAICGEAKAQNLRSLVHAHDPE